MTLENERTREEELAVLLNKLAKDDKISIDATEDLLSWRKHNPDNFKILKRWEDEGEIIITKKHQIKAVEGQNRTKGVISIIKNRFAFLDRDNKESIFIPKTKLNGAFDGDTVIVKINEVVSHGKKLEGEVIKVIKRHSSVVVGKLEFDKKRHFGFVVPMNSAGTDIYIPKRYIKNAKNGEIVSVEMTFWGDRDKKPEGRIKEIIGHELNTKSMIEALIVREGMSNSFPLHVVSEARNILTEIRKEDIVERVDLRALPIITIDGDDSKDLDDAVYVEKLENGNYRLVVSIADVSHYVQLGSELDKEALTRGNSVYLVDRVLPMFPPEISNGICSLNEKEDKLCFTADLEIDNQAKVVSSKTYKSIIHSVHRMTYDNVNKMLAGDETVRQKYFDILDMVDVMEELSKILQADKYKRGSIDFDLTELKVILDNNGNVKEIQKRDRGIAEKIIEDFMIAANEAVARELERAEIPAIYRTHEKPDGERIYRLNDTLGKFGYFIEDVENITSKQFQHIIDDSQSKNLSMIVHKMILMSLKQARYTVDNIGHFGLASESYTHFTSPIRRYADLTVHRILDCLHKKEVNTKEFIKFAHNFPSVTKHISETERVAMKAEDESVRIKIVDYMKDKIDMEYDATVIGFSNKKVFFETNEYVECSWNVVNSEHYYEFDEHEYIMKDREDGSKFYSLGDKIRIKILGIDMNLLEINVSPVE